MFRAVVLQSDVPRTSQADPSEPPHCTGPLRGGDDISAFQEGPGLRECFRPVIQFLRHWRLRPLSVWKQRLTGDGWMPWQASLVTRFATFLWFLAGHLAIGLLIVAVLYAMGALVKI